MSRGSELAVVGLFRGPGAFDLGLQRADRAPELSIGLAEFELRAIRPVVIQRGDAISSRHQIQVRSYRRGARPTESLERESSLFEDEQRGAQGDDGDEISHGGILDFLRPTTWESGDSVATVERVMPRAESCDTDSVYSFHAGLEAFPLGGLMASSSTLTRSIRILPDC
jgi:hypothetical protein